MSKDPDQDDKLTKAFTSYIAVVNNPMISSKKKIIARDLFVSKYNEKDSEPLLIQLGLITLKSDCKTCSNCWVLTEKGRKL